MSVCKYIFEARPPLSNHLVRDLFLNCFQANAREQGKFNCLQKLVNNKHNKVIELIIGTS